jgi:hypothetical protein
MWAEGLGVECGQRVWELRSTQAFEISNLQISNKQLARHEGKR